VVQPSPPSLGSTNVVAVSALGQTYMVWDDNRSTTSGEDIYGIGWADSSYGLGWPPSLLGPHSAGPRPLAALAALHSITAETLISTAAPASAPALSTPTVIMLVLLLAIGGVFAVRRRSPSSFIRTMPS